MQPISCPISFMQTQIGLVFRRGHMGRVCCLFLIKLEWSSQHHSSFRLKSDAGCSGRSCNRASFFCSIPTSKRSLHTSPSEVTLQTKSRTQSKQHMLLLGDSFSLIMLQEAASASTSWRAGEISCRCVFVICKLLSDTKAQQGPLVLASADVN